MSKSLQSDYTSMTTEVHQNEKLFSIEQPSKYEIIEPNILSALSINLRLMTSGENFVPGNEIMKRFNAQVKAGMVQPTKETNISLINIHTVLETAPESLYPLQVAIMQSNIFMIKQLLKDGAYLHVKDKTGKTALANAFELGNVDIINLLVAAKDAEFQNSPQSPYAQSCCATVSVSDFLLSSDSDEKYHDIEPLNHSYDITTSRNNSFSSAKEIGGEPPSVISHNEAVQCDSIVSDNRDGVDGEKAHNFKAFSEAEKTTDDDSAKTDQKDCTAAVPSAPLAGQQKPKKPMAGRVQNAVGKMLAYMRPPKHSGDDDDSNGHRHATIQ